MKIETGFLRRLGSCFVLVGAVALIAGCGGGGSADPQDYTPVEVAIQAGFDTSDADPRGMRFVFDQDIAPSISKSAAKAAARDPADYIAVTDAEGEELSTTRRWLDSRTLMLFAQVKSCATYGVTFKAGFPVSLNEGMAQEQSFSVTFAPDSADANGDCAADPVLVKQYRVIPDPVNPAEPITQSGGVYPFNGLLMGNLDSPLDFVLGGLSSSLLPLYRPVGEFYPTDAANIGDVDNDGRSEFAYVNKYLIIYGLDENGNAEIKTTIDVAGQAVEPRWVGDVTGDGIDDIFGVVDVTKAGTPGAVFEGGENLPLALTLDDAYAILQPPDEVVAWAEVEGLHVGMFAVEGVGDVTGNGVNDIAVAYAAGEIEPPSFPAALVAIHEGAAEEDEAASISKAPLPTTTPITQAKHLIESPAGTGKAFGYSIAGGDIDGDGVTELLIGAPGVVTAGSAYLYGDGDFESPRAIFSAGEVEAASIAKMALPEFLSTVEPEKSFGMGVAIADLISAGPREVIISSPLEYKVYIYSDDVVRSDDGALSLAGTVGVDSAKAVVKLAEGVVFRDELKAAVDAADPNGIMALWGFSIRAQGDPNNDGLESVAIYGKQLGIKYEQIGAECTWALDETGENRECTELLALGVNDGNQRRAAFGDGNAYCDMDADSDAVQIGLSGDLYCSRGRAYALLEDKVVTLEDCCEERAIISTTPV
ncbi:MAG TPA: FG-GAP repeat protein, partial [bacterium]|nr:FG-GAP repeat protein [bacterium]